ncbi:NAD(P)/FAD-dependent oxidoreductase [Actibacterium sp. MT2.3-13A]|uniref:NAD(P)/FAD-dependent oxidoreductase n=1 Tax=Actibacterium sp. MT2.3-13A TaxID=2828332 RepID=UPI001BA847A4|nr:NAD(P)/FAD-dependent oxidoreductase [Actibacterium sp. MT2.3-13A]
MAPRVAIIIGAGPAGLTAAYELATRSDIRPILFEAGDQVGGISKTVNYKGNRIDIGGHRFFSKSRRVMDWWLNILPLEAGAAAPGEAIALSYHNRRHDLSAPRAGADPEATDEVMLVRPRVSRILFDGKFFDYPIRFGLGTLARLGPARTARIMAGYARARMRPIRPEVSLRDFIINRFGRELYETFFENYTEKVWGVPCEEIPAGWGAQRIKGVSISALVRNALRKLRPQSGGIAQRGVETSLIERFLYPKHGPGQLWEKVAGQVTARGGELHCRTRVVALNHDGERVTSVVTEDANGTRRTVACDYVFSSMAVKDLIAGWTPPAPAAVAGVAGDLPYRDFITIGVLLSRLRLAGGTDAAGLSQKIPDNWIYVQEPGVKVGRIQIFNNWSPALVADPGDIWLGLEYFVNEGDDFWTLPDAEMTEFAVRELGALGFALPEDVKDSVVVRSPKAYPAYFGSYERFDVVRDYVSGFANLYCVGRNGMHRYNNQDHSMLTAMVSVDGILEGRDVHEEVWDINTEEEYHETRGGG